MKVLVIGAAGKSGRVVVEGDATDRSAIDSAMLGQDAVIDTIGGKNPLKATTLEASVAGTITASMQSSGVRRLVVISMIGEGESIANTNWWERAHIAKTLRRIRHNVQGSGARFSP